MRTDPHALRYVAEKGYDHAQVAPWLEDFTTLHDEMVAAGKYPYNDNFKGLIPGIVGPDEDKAIYLLQGLRRITEENAREVAFMADGGEEIDPATLTDKPERFSVVVHRNFYVGGTGWDEWHDARLLRTLSGSVAVLPKGKRTRGHMLSGRVIAKRAGR